MKPISRPLEPKEGHGTTTGEMISFGKRRDAGTGYCARSERVGPGVLVLHEFFGLTQSFKDKADRLNEAGFTVLAPDLYDGKIATSVEEAQSFARSLDSEKVMLQIEAAAEHLTANWHPRLGLVGFSLGAAFAFELPKRRDVEAVVVYYGLGDVNVRDWRAPLLGHFAETDEWEDLGEVRKLFDSFDEAGADAELFVYPGTGHWFANPEVPDAFDPAASEEAWTRTVDFLTHNLA